MAFEERSSAPEEPPFDASDEAQVQKRRRTAGNRAAAQKVALRKFLEIPAGRQWVWDLLEVCHLYRTSFDPTNEQSDRLTFFREGERNIGLYVLGQIEQHAPESLRLMMNEKSRNG